MDMKVKNLQQMIMFIDMSIMGGRGGDREK